MDKKEYEFNEVVSNFIKTFKCEVAEIRCVDGFEVKENILYIWGFGQTPDYWDIIYGLLKENSSVDTIYIGKTVTDSHGELRKFNAVLGAARNLIPVIKDIIVEDTIRYYSIDGLLIDRWTQTVIEYVPGRQDDSLTIPSGVKTLKGNCFHYIGNVKRLYLPSTITEIDGISDLPRLEEVIIAESPNNVFTSAEGIVYMNSETEPYFIPPYNPSYPSCDDLDRVFANLFKLVKTEAEKGRWAGVTADCFEYDSWHEILYINYSGGFYEQQWSLEFDRLPTRIAFRYHFSDWECECVCEMIDNDYSGDLNHSVRCSGCASRVNCDGAYRSNETYMSRVKEKCHDSGIARFEIVDNFNMEGLIGIDITEKELSLKLLEFIDIALDYRLKYPILDRLLQVSLFDGLTPEETCPFNFSYSRYPVGYVSCKAENIAVGED